MKEAARPATVDDLDRLAEMAAAAVAEQAGARGGDIWSARESRAVPARDSLAADLDAILKDRLVVADDDEDEEEDEPVDAEDKADGGKVRPRAPGEFVCQSCFLVKHPSQLADAKRQLCRDCV